MLSPSKPGVQVKIRNSFTNISLRFDSKYKYFSGHQILATYKRCLYMFIPCMSCQKCFSVVNKYLSTKKYVLKHKIRIFAKTFDTIQLEMLSYEICRMVSF